MTRTMLSLLLLATSPAAALPTARAHVATRDLAGTMRLGWLRGSKPSAGSQPIRFTIFLQQEGLDALSKTFDAVSDPASPSYGKFLTKEQLDAMVFAKPESRVATKKWLSSFGAGVSIQDEVDSIVVSTTASVGAAMFACEFHQYTHARTGRTRVLASGSLTVPAELRSHWHLVTGLTELWRGRERTPKRAVLKDTRASADTDIKVTPAVLRSYYNIPSGEKNEAANNLQAIAAFDDYYDAEALTDFETHFGEPTATITAQGIDCLTDPKPCDEVESDLDVQYITAIGSATDTLFFNANSTDSWILTFTENAVKLSPLPMVFSLSYGWAELKQCDIAYSICNTLGYSSTDYVDRSNTGLQKLATLGASIMVSDGDDGAVGNSPDGADPIDPDRWCGGSEYTCYPKTTSKCAEIFLTNQSLSPPKSCPWPIGALGPHCEFLFLGDFYQDADIYNALNAANPTCGLQIFYDTSYGVHLYSDCECSALTPISHKGVVSEPYVFDKTQRVFYADFPTGSPYVTSVGATTFKSSDGTTVSAEHVASIVDGAIITTGGGFSAITPQPTWQADAVSAWDTGAPAAAKPPSFTYDTTMRGYPDVTLNGHNYQVYYKDKGTVSLGGVDGTSASSPAFAGIISLLNGHLLAAGKTQLGFLNPTLYAMAKAKPSAFKDVTFGDNKCTRNFCMKYGYNATSGWDPVAGLGSIDYGEMKEYILALKGVKAKAVSAAACESITDKKTCDSSGCSWCLAGAVPDSCKTIDDAKKLPPSVFQCDNIGVVSAPLVESA